MVKGRPRYWIRMLSVVHPKREDMVGISSFGIAMGRKSLLLRLICRPETSAKVFSAATISLIFVLCTGVIIAVSLVNCSRVIGVVGMSIRSGCSF
jgi:hypothetical protein